jgi:hypothetical protein
MIIYISTEKIREVLNKVVAPTIGTDDPHYVYRVVEETIDALVIATSEQMLRWMNPPMLYSPQRTVIKFHQHKNSIQFHYDDGSSTSLPCSKQLTGGRPMAPGVAQIGEDLYHTQCAPTDYEGDKVETEVEGDSEEVCKACEGLLIERPIDPDSETEEPEEEAQA